MTLIDKDTLGVLIPAFRIPRVQVLWDGDVNFVNSKGQFHERVCLISTIGIYIIKKKSFPHPAKVVDYIVISDLNTIIANENKATFKTYQNEITIQHENISPFVGITHCIRKAQFPLNILPLKTKFPNEEMFGLINDTSPYQPASLFIDRVITCAVHLRLEISLPLLKMIISELKVIHSSFKITKKLINSPLFHAVTLALPYDLDLHRIIIDSCPLASVLPFFDELFTRGKLIKELDFINCDFTDSLQSLQNLLSTTSIIKPSKWIFSNIVINDSFTSFFDSLNLLNCNVYSLTFDSCTFTYETMSAVFQSILFNSCFHNLESFSFDGVNNSYDLPLQISSLQCSNWVLLTKCLHFISLSKNNFDATTLIPQLLTIDIGLRKLRMAECNFTSTLSFSKPPPVNHLLYLDLTGSRFTSKSILSIFNLIHSKTLVINGINLSRIGLNSDEKTEFLSKLYGIELDLLTTFVFDNNELNNDQTLLLSNFIINQRNLKNLSLNNCIDCTNIGPEINVLLDAIDTINLESLCIRADKSQKYCFGKVLVENIIKIISKPTLLYFDLRNQIILDEGLYKITQYLLHNSSYSLRQLFVDGTYATLNSLLEYCEATINSQLIYAAYPSNDLLMAIANSAEDSNKLQRLESELFNRFFSKFSKNPCEPPWEIELEQPCDNNPKNVSPVKRDQKIPCLKQFSIIKYFTDSVFQRESNIESLFLECIDTKSHNYKEAIMKFVETIDEKVSFNSLMKVDSGP